MFSTIFRKQFIMYILNLTLCFIILGASLIGLLQNYFFSQKEQLLLEQAKRISDEFIKTKINRIVAFGNILFDSFRNEIGTLYTYTGTSCFYCEIIEDGEDSVTLRVALYTANLRVDNLNKVIDYPEVKPSYKGEIIKLKGTFNGAFDEKMLLVGYPIEYNGFVFGVIFMNTPISEIERSTQEVVTITLICLLISAIVSFILIFFSSKSISKPIYQINDVAKIIAAGDFAKRLSVKSKDEVGQLAESFNNMAESLENQEASRRSFISNISHDLRTPLTSMKGFLQALLDGTIPPEKHEKYLKIVLDESERLSRLTDDLMFIGKFQNFDADLQITKFDVNELIRTTIIKFEQRINDKAINIEVSFADEKNIVEADYEKIQRVIYNLIDNAIKFQDINGTISLKTEIEPRNIGKIYVKVKDNGIGISTEDQKKVFERFYKSDKSRGKDRTGSGLGLAIVKEFIMAHNERIELISKLGEGSEFIFSLKLES